jgi:hypothetical protein
MTDSIWLTWDTIWLWPSLVLAAGAIAAQLKVFFKTRWGGVRAGADRRLPDSPAAVC